MNDSAGGDIYESLVEAYDSILQKYENHSRIDYLFTKNHMNNYYKNPWYFPFYVRCLYFLQFVPYILLLGIEFIWIYTIVKPAI